MSDTESGAKKAEPQPTPEAEENAINIRDIVINALSQAGANFPEQLFDNLDKNGDLFILLQLSQLAGGSQLLQNRIKPQGEPFVLYSNKTCRRYKFLSDDEISFPDLDFDVASKQQSLIPVSSLQFSYSQLQNTPFEKLYIKKPFLSKQEAGKLPQKSQLNLAYQVLEAPHADFMKGQAGYIRREVMTSVLEDLKPDDFGPHTDVYNAVQLRCFLDVKRQIIKAMYIRFPDIDKLLEFMQKAVKFCKKCENCIVVDWGKQIQYVREMTPLEYEEYMEMKQSDAQPDNLSERAVSEPIGAYSNCEASETSKAEPQNVLLNSVVSQNNELLEGSEQTENKRYYIQKAKTMLLQEMANFDVLTESMTPDQKEQLYEIYLSKLEQINELETISEQNQCNVLRNSNDSSKENNMETDGHAVPAAMLDASDNEDFHFSNQPYSAEENDAENCNEENEVAEEPNDSEEEYDEVSDVEQHEEYMKAIANSPQSEKKPLESLSEAEINSEEEEVHDIANQLPEPESLPAQDVFQQLLKAPETKFVSYLKLNSNNIVQAEIPKLPVFSYCDFSTVFQPLILPNASERGQELVEQIEQKVDKMRDKNYLTRCYNQPQQSTYQTSSNLRVFYDPLRTGAAEIPANLNEEAEVPFAEGEVICSRYELVKMCGQATFSNCFSAVDLSNGKEICLKVIKNDKEFLDQALDEIHLLELIKELDPEEDNRVISVEDYFYYREHLIIIFKLYGEDLFVHFDKLQHEGLKNDYSIPIIKEIAKELLNSFDFLARLNICHLDAKPENILHCKEQIEPVDVKLVDLGSSSFIFDKIHQYIQSRSYRAPEIMIGLPYDERADIWSLGAIIAELLTGEVLFPNHSVATMMARVNALIGPYPRCFLLSGRASCKYLTGGLIAFEEEDNNESIVVPEQQGLLEMWLFDDCSDLTDEELLFSDFVRQMLVIDYLKRPTAEILKQHFWLKE